MRWHFTTNSAYVSPDWFAETADALERFGRQVHGGLYDLDAGTPGPEFADGATVARFHWYRPTQLFISTQQESDFFLPIGARRQEQPEVTASPALTATGATRIR